MDEADIILICIISFVLIILLVKSCTKKNENSEIEKEYENSEIEKEYENNEIEKWKRVRAFKFDGIESSKLYTYKTASGLNKIFLYLHMTKDQYYEWCKKYLHKYTNIPEECFHCNKKNIGRYYMPVIDYEGNGWIRPFYNDIIFNKSKDESKFLCFDCYLKSKNRWTESGIIKPFNSCKKPLNKIRIVKKRALNPA